jgi:hypothetical protein
MRDQAVNEARVWPSAREMRVVRAIMIAGVAVIAAASLRHYGKIFDFVAVAFLVSTGLLYRATHPKNSHGASLPKI